ncbi:MAG: hypothetical protein HON65_14475, partial [Rhodospirillales bacterium]|nr:hypothetical protein [Rhodospirillales bacterium]
NVQIEFDDTLLTWAGWERAVDIRVVNLRVHAKEDTIFAQIPEVSVSLSTKALLQGAFAPSALEMSGPTLHLVRSVEGNVNLAFAGIGAMMSGQLEPVLVRLSETPNPKSLFSYLEKLEVINADVIVEDSTSEQTWVTPDVDIKLRKSTGRIDAETSFLVDMDNAVADVSFIAGYDDATKRIDAGISFSHIMPAVLGRLTSELEFLKYANIPVHGTLMLAASVKGKLESIGFDLVGEAGQIHLPAPLEGTLKANNFILNGIYDAQAGRLEVDALYAELAEDQQIMLPSLISHPYPITDFSFSGAYVSSQERIEINKLDINLGGRLAHINGAVDDILNLPRGKIIVDIPELTVAEAALYWPSSIGEDAYKWFMSNVLSGTGNNLHTEIEGGVTESGEFEVSRIVGGFDINDASILYMDTMPPITDVNAVATFNHDQFDMSIASSQSHGMNLGTGKVLLTALSGDHEKIEIRTSMKGPFQKAMELINLEPMVFASEIGIDPEKVDGETRVELAFDFPLKESVEWEEVKFSADALVEKVNIPGGLFDLDVNDGMLNLAIDNSGMDIKGHMLLNNFPTDIKWRQNFLADASFQNQYELSVQVKDVKSFTDLGIDVRPFSADMISGQMPLNLKVTQNFTGPTKLEANASLDEMTVYVPAINWYKSIGVPGKALAVFYIENDVIVEIPEFSLETDELELVGSAHYSEANGQLDRIKLNRIAYGRTDLSGILVPGATGVWDADFSGTSLDLSPVWEDMMYGDLFDSGERVLENITVSTQFDKVWLSQDRFIESMTGAFVQAEDKWRTVYITANVASGAPLQIKLSPSELENKRILTAWSTDAGSVLKTFDIYNTMLDGELSLAGHFDDDDENSPLYGFFDVKDYRIVGAPTLAKVVSIMSLTGIADALQGDGLAFTTLHIPFRYGGGVLELREAKATGSSLGFTAAGKLYTHADAIDVTGTMVPVYAMNSLLGKIPLLGNIFTGGEEGGGIFAADYYMSGSIDDPEISVNPLSMLTPGFLRNIFNVFESDKLPEGVETGN